MRVMGLDVGDRTIGIALSDELGVLGQGFAVHRRCGLKADLDRLEAICREQDVGQVVVGLPRRLDGGIGPQAEKVLAFVDTLRQRLSLPVVTWDERLTTRRAERALLEADMSRRKRRAVVDQVAAGLILQSYLDTRRHATAAGGYDKSGVPGDPRPDREGQVTALEREEGDFVVLTDEDGEEHEFELVDVFDVEGREYAVLASAEDEDEDEAIVLRVEKDDDGNDVLVDIEDDSEWEKVAARWDEILEEEPEVEFDEDNDEE